MVVAATIVALAFRALRRKAQQFNLTLFALLGA